MIGQMRERVSIQQNTATKTKGVQDAQSWSTLDTVYGRLRPLSARELQVADQNREIVTHEITLRYRSDYEDGHMYRLLIGTRAFDIKSIENKDFRNRLTIIRAEEKV